MKLSLSHRTLKKATVKRKAITFCEVYFHNNYHRTHPLFFRSNPAPAAIIKDLKVNHSVIGGMGFRDALETAGLLTYHEIIIP